MNVSELFQLPAAGEVATVAVRLAAAAIFGGLLGLERHRAGKSAGLRTHMLVALGSALFVVFPAQAGMETGDLSRVIQGVATGIGFIGAGTILKRTDPEEVHGLTTAAGLWMTAGIGLAAGAGRLWVPMMASVLAWTILSVLARVEKFNDKI